MISPYRRGPIKSGHDALCNTNPHKGGFSEGDSPVFPSVLRFSNRELDSEGSGMGAPMKVTREERTPKDLPRMAGDMKDASHARRLRAIAFVMDGWARSQAADFANVDRQTLRDRVKRHNVRGAGALATLTSPGSSRLLTPDQDKELHRITTDGPDLGKDGVVRWRCVDLVQRAAARFSVPEMHPSTMAKWLRRLGLTKLTARPFHPRKDEAAQQAFKRNFSAIVNDALPAEVKEEASAPVVWFQDG
jgi:transposase